jgi:hypothetical protein
VTYQINKPKSGGTIFTCAFCPHTVNTLDFDSENGNRRTQAATVINQHVALLHSRMPFSPAALHLCPEPADGEVYKPSLAVHAESESSSAPEARAMDGERHGTLGSVRMELSGPNPGLTLASRSVLEPEQKD